VTRESKTAGAVWLKPNSELGGLGLRSVLAALVCLLLCVGCEVYAGKLYWAGQAPGFSVTSSCAAGVDSDAQPIAVYVGDSTGAPIPGVHVSLSQPALGTVKEENTDVTGFARTAVASGIWQVEAKLNGFYTGRLSLEIPAASSCTVTFRLELERQNAVTVAANGKAA
jgi:hypothetical protein